MTADPHAMVCDKAMDHVLGASAETSSDLRRRAASNQGVPNDLDALVDKIHLADTLGWEVPSTESFRRTGRMLLKRGYQ